MILLRSLQESTSDRSINERALMFAKGSWGTGISVLPPDFSVALDEGSEIAYACFNEAELASIVKPDHTTAFISHQEAWNKTSELLFYANSMPSLEDISFELFRIRSGGQGWGTQKGPNKLLSKLFFNKL